ncbi:glycosyltransferase family 61 protein [Neobacillus sp. Marseille-QA0830]
MSKFLPPKEIYNNARDWMATINNDPYFNKILLKSIYPAATFSRQISRPPIKYPKLLEEGYVTVIPYGRVWGRNGAILTPDDSLLWDVSLEFIYPRSNHSIFQRETLPPITDHFHKIADLTHTGSVNYYHWMYETIPRFDLLSKSQIEVGQYIVNYEPERFPYQADSLSELGIKTEQIIKTHHDFHIQAENLVVPSQPSFATKWAYDFLRKTFLNEKTLKSSERKRIYISRKWARKIINEDELMDILNQFGFIKVGLEELSVNEQVQLFASADVIIGAHGAGLVNLTFCRPGTKVLEIFSPRYVTPLYWAISSFGTLDYYSYIAERDPNQSTQYWSGVDDIKINPKKLIQILKSMRI